MSKVISPVQKRILRMFIVPPTLKDTEVQTQILFYLIVFKYKNNCLFNIGKDGRYYLIDLSRAMPPMKVKTNEIFKILKKVKFLEIFKKYYFYYYQSR